MDTLRTVVGVSEVTAVVEVSEVAVVVVAEVSVDDAVNTNINKT